MGRAETANDSRGRSDSSRDSPGRELAVSLRAAGKEAEQKLTIGFPAQHLGKYWWSIIVAHHQVIAREGIDHDPSVTQVSMYDARLVLLVVINPQLYDRPGHRPMVARSVVRFEARVLHRQREARTQ